MTQTNTKLASFVVCTWSAYVDPPSEDIWKEQHLSLELWAKLCTHGVVFENHFLEARPLVFVHRIIPLKKV